jgi:hypothetical protein
MEHVIQNSGTEHGWRRFARLLGASLAWFFVSLFTLWAVAALCFDVRRIWLNSSGIGFRSIPFGRFHFRKGDMTPSGWLRRMFHDSSVLVAFYRAIEQSRLAGGCFSDGLGGGARRPGNNPQRPQL